MLGPDQHIGLDWEAGIPMGDDEICQEGGVDVQNNVGLKWATAFYYFYGTILQLKGCDLLL